MLYLLISFFSFILLFGEKSIAQTREKEVSFFVEGKDLTKFLQKNIKFPKEFYQAKERPVTISCVRFIVNEKGNVDSVHVYAGTTEPAHRELQRLLLLTNGHWSPKQINNKPVKSKPLILPVVFVYEGNRLQNMNADELKHAFKGLFTFLSSPQNRECTVLAPIEIIAFEPMR